MKTFATLALSALVLAGCAKTEEAAAPVEAEAAPAAEAPAPVEAAPAEAAPAADAAVTETVTVPAAN